MRSRLISILLLTALLGGCAPAERTTGFPRVVDGDSLEIGTTSIRLFGVDAPEAGQPCTRNGEVWRCGSAATARLRQLVASDSIVCETRDTDRYGRSVAHCVNGEIDLAAELALSGLALAYRQYSLDYVDEEAEARAARRGIWAGEFQAPWDYRRNPGQLTLPSARPSATPASPSAGAGECRIKGNINSRGERIYHVPGSRSYEQTVITTARGERMFCSEQEAITAGWRAPRG